VANITLKILSIRTITFERYKFLRNNISPIVEALVPSERARRDFDQRLTLHLLSRWFKPAGRVVHASGGSQWQTTERQDCTN
jgi:hypothetical protein